MVRGILDSLAAVQARAHGALPGSLEDVRAVAAASTDLVTFAPRETP